VESTDAKVHICTRSMLLIYGPTTLLRIKETKLQHQSTVEAEGFPRKYWKSGQTVSGVASGSTLKASLCRAVSCRLYKVQEYCSRRGTPGLRGQWALSHIAKVPGDMREDRTAWKRSRVWVWRTTSVLTLDAKGSSDAWSDQRRSRLKVRHLFSNIGCSAPDSSI
jgi:hypothetical protein